MAKVARAHQADRDEERALAPQPVADDAEDERAQRAEGEAGGEQAEGRDQRRGRVEPGEENLGDGRGEAAEDEEVVPFERGAGRRGDDHPRHRPGLVVVLCSAMLAIMLSLRRGIARRRLRTRRAT